jgi:hypothetical protein
MDISLAEILQQVTSLGSIYPFLCGDLVLAQMFVQSLCSIDVVAGWELPFSLTSTLEPYQVHDQ